MKGVVLVTDGEQRAALATIRSLGRAGYRCIVSSASGRSLAGASRHSQREERVPDPASAPGEHAAAVRELVAAEGVGLVIPISEPSILSLLPARDGIPAAIPFPALATFQAICDKGRVLREAAEVGIRVPGQVEVRSAEEGRDIELDLPLVLKPGRSVYTAPDGTRAKVGVRWARSRAELRAALEAYPPAAYPILAQEAIEGPGVGVFVLLHEGRLVARFSHRRLREKPPSGGVSVLRQSEPMDPALLDRSLALLERFRWSGVAMVEYKLDRRTGEAYLMEINGRLWGSLQLAIDAGVDFPRLLAAVTFGNAVEPVETYRFTRSRWFWGDVDHVAAVWRDASASWSERLGSLGGWLRSFGPGHRSEVFRWSDPRPFARESLRWLQDATHR